MQIEFCAAVPTGGKVAGSIGTDSDGRLLLSFGETGCKVGFRLGWFTRTESPLRDIHALLPIPQQRAVPSQTICSRHFEIYQTHSHHFCVALTRAARSLLHGSAW